MYPNECSPRKEFGALHHNRYDALVSALRYRCTICGNLTRFDVTSSRRTRAFHHYSVGGELTIEDEEVLGFDIESVICRWCGPAAAVETIEAGDAEGATDAVPNETAES